MWSWDGNINESKAGKELIHLLSPALNYKSEGTGLVFKKWECYSDVYAIYSLAGDGKKNI